MQIDNIIKEVTIKTELGLVRVWLAPGEGNRSLHFTGSENACEYVAMLFSTSYGERGRLLGSSCTESEFHFLITNGPLAELVNL